jgi:hypothetical protein
MPRAEYEQSHPVAHMTDEEIANVRARMWNEAKALENKVADELRAIAELVAAGDDALSAARDALEKRLREPLKTWTLAQELRDTVHDLDD